MVMSSNRWKPWVVSADRDHSRATTIFFPKFPSKFKAQGLDMTE